MGRTRSVWLSILWFFLTLGIYSFVWVYRTFGEMKRYSGEGVGGAVALAIYVPGFVASWVVDEVGTGGIWLIVIGIGLLQVLVCMLASSETHDLYERDGRKAPHTRWWGLWFLLPVIGAFIWFIPTQRSLNEFWVSKGAAPRGASRHSEAS